MNSRYSSIRSSRISVFSASATDKAGNSGSGSTSFTVSVTGGSLGQLTKQFVQGSAKYKALKQAQKQAVDAVLDGLSRTLAAIVPRLTPAQKAALVNAYKAGVQALVQPGWLTAAQATTLKTLADAL
jgi:hypothetical protein